MTIENVSDTARWVAVYRAMESERPDAIFRDPFARIGAESKNPLVVSEGLLSYLPSTEVTGLAEALAAAPTFKFWLTDSASNRLLKMMNRMWGKSAAAASAPFLFGPESGTAFLS